MESGTVITWTAKANDSDAFNTLSAAITFDGEVKVKADDVPNGGALQLLEERSDGDYEPASDGLILEVGYRQTSQTFYLKGSYKFYRTDSEITGAYVS